MAVEPHSLGASGAQDRASTRHGRPTPWHLTGGARVVRVPVHIGADLAEQTKYLNNLESL